MKILLVVTGLGMGGAENQVINLAEALAIKGHKVTLAYLLEPALVLPRSGQVQVVWLGGAKSILGMAKALVRLSKLVTRSEPDVVHSHMFHANILSRLAGMVGKIRRLVCTAHSNVEGGALRMLLYRLTDSLADEFTNVSQAAVESFVRLKAAPAGRMLVTHNGIDTQRFSFNSVARQQLRDELGIQDNRVFIAIGRFHEAKDYPNLLNAFSIFNRRQSDSHLLIVGEGELRPEIKQQIKVLGLQSRVSLLGIRKDVPELLSAADVFVLSSAWEGFGLVVAEAMATERIVIATNSGGVKEVLGNNGFLVAPRDSIMLAESMRKAIMLSESEAREYGKKSRQYILENFGLDRVVERWLEIYK